VENLPQTNDGMALVVCFVFSALFDYCSSSIPYVMLKKKINLDAILVLQRQSKWQTSLKMAMN